MEGEIAQKEGFPDEWEIVFDLIVPEGSVYLFFLVGINNGPVPKLKSLTIFYDLFLLFYRYQNSQNIKLLTVNLFVEKFSERNGVVFWLCDDVDIWDFLEVGIVVEHEFEGRNVIVFAVVIWLVLDASVADLVNAVEFQVVLEFIGSIVEEVSRYLYVWSVHQLDCQHSANLVRIFLLEFLVVDLWHSAEQVPASQTYKQTFYCLVVFYVPIEGSSLRNSHLLSFLFLDVWMFFLYWR